jgi:hypothetical protein
MKTQQEIESMVRQLNIAAKPNFPYRFTATCYFRDALKWVLEQEGLPSIVQDAVKGEQ